MRRLRRRRNGNEEGGFTLVETVVAMFVIATVLLGLVMAQAKSQLALTTVRQRQQLTSQAERMLEVVRALPWSVVSQGLNASDLAGDPNISGTTFAPTADPSISEPLVTSAAQATYPLAPHVQATSPTILNATLTSSVYVTQAAGWTAAVPVVWVTVISSRVSGPGPAPKPVVARSQVFAPQGCLGTATRPYSGPCTAFLTGSSGSTGGQLALDQNGNAAVPELGLGAGSAGLPGFATAVQGEQTSQATSRAATASAQTTPAGGPAGTSGGVTATASADDDPASALAPNPPAVTETQAAAARSTTGSFGTVTFTPSASGTADAVAGLAASATVPCRDLADVVIATSQPCASARLGTPGATTLSLAPTAINGRTFASATLASVAAPASGSPGRAWVGRFPITSASHCTGLTATGTSGCISSGATRSTGTATVGGIPAKVAGDTVPSGFTSMATVTGLVQTATAEQGTGNAVPAATRAGSISYWNGTTYTSLTLDATARSVTMGTLTATYKVGAQTLTMTLTGTITVAATTAATTGPTAASPACSTDACVSTASVAAPVIRVLYTITKAGAPVATFGVTLDPGALQSTASYRAAPSA